MPIIVSLLADDISKHSSVQKFHFSRNLPFYSTKKTVINAIELNSFHDEKKMKKKSTVYRWSNNVLGVGSFRSYLNRARRSGPRAS